MNVSTVGVEQLCSCAVLGAVKCIVAPLLAEGDAGDKKTEREGGKETVRQGDRETGRQGDQETERQGDQETRRREDGD
jgi:hypothetical protein